MNSVIFLHSVIVAGVLTQKADIDTAKGGRVLSALAAKGHKGRGGEMSEESDLLAVEAYDPLTEPRRRFGKKGGVARVAGRLSERDGGAAILAEHIEFAATGRRQSAE